MTASHKMLAQSPHTEAHLHKHPQTKMHGTQTTWLNKKSAGAISVRASVQDNTKDTNLIPCSQTEFNKHLHSRLKTTVDQQAPHGSVNWSRQNIRSSDVRASWYVTRCCHSSWLGSMHCWHPVPHPASKHCNVLAGPVILEVAICAINSWAHYNKHNPELS